MSGLFGGGGGGSYMGLGSQQQSTPQYVAQSSDMAAENASLYERLRRASAYGKQQTMISSNNDWSTAAARQKAFLGASA